MEPENWFYAGCGLFVIGLACLWGYLHYAKRLRLILQTPTIACKDLPGLGASIVEVKGTVEADVPLTSDLCSIPCVAFTSTITEHWTTTRTVTDSKGGSRTVTDHHTAVRYQNDARIDFNIRDTSGLACVEIDGADLEMIDQAAGPASSQSPAFGVCPMHWNGHLTYTESLLPVGCTGYILAQVTERHTLGKPINVDSPFLISSRSEESIVRSARWGKGICGVAFTIALVGGGGAFAYWYQITGGAWPWQSATN
jgi:hypothetical protein